MENTYLTFLILIDVSAFIILIIYLLRYLPSRVLFAKEANNSTQRFYLEKNKYAIAFKGGMSVQVGNNFSIEVKNDNIIVKISKKLFRTRFYYKWKKCTIYYNFIIEQSDYYSIRINNPEELIIKGSMLYSKKIFEKPKNLNDIQILFLIMTKSKRGIIISLILILIIVVITTGIAIIINH